MNKFDVAVIGAGPAGYVSAIRAAQLGLKTAIIEKEHVGGVCLNWGCIPTKALLRCADFKHMADHASDFGFKISGLESDPEKIVKRSRKVVDQLTGGVKNLLKKNGVSVFNGSAKILQTAAKNKDGGVIEVMSPDGSLEKVVASNIIIATGARARTLPNAPSDSPQIWYAKQAMQPKSWPKSLLIIGSGAIGTEFASFYNAMGSKVTMVEYLPRILPQEDEEVSAKAQDIFKGRGMDIRVNTQATKIVQKGQSISVTLEPAGKAQGAMQEVDADAVIVAIGVVGNTEGLGLENTKVKIEKNQIIIDEWCQTSEPGIFAIGDVAGSPWLAHKASHQGIICVEKIAGVKHVKPLNPLNIPGCTYSSPQVASIGLTEAKAKENGHDVKVGRFQFMGNGKAIAMGETDGFIKTIFDAKTGELLGAHLIGAEVTEMIQGFALAKTLEATEHEIMHTIFPHPTLSESMHEAVLDAYDRVIHWPPKAK